MGQASARKALEKNDIPLLLFHGEEDGFVLPEHSIENWQIDKGEKELVLIPGAYHICGSYAAAELYRNKLMEFFAKNDDRGEEQHG